MNDDTIVRDLTFRVNHTMLPVGDLDRAIAFYTRLLGMKLKSRYRSDSRKVAVGLVGYDGDTMPLLELTEDIGDQALAEVVPANIHIAIDVNDLRRLCAILEREGIKLVHPLKARSDGRGFGAWIHDPDGNPIELAERP